MKAATIIPVSPATLAEIHPGDWCRLRVLDESEPALVVSFADRLRNQVRVYLPESVGLTWLPGSTRVLRAHLASIRVDLDGVGDEHSAAGPIGGAA